MTTSRFIILAACSTLCLAGIGCKRQPSAFPLSLQTVHQFDPTNTAQISFEERGSEIFVSVTDKHGDGHIHKLSYDGISKQQALILLKQKQTELEARR